MLVELIAALIKPNKYIDSEKISILVTGISVNSFKLKLFENFIYENDYPFGKYIEKYFSNSHFPVQEDNFICKK